MRQLGKSITLGFVGATLAVYGFLTPAAAYSPQGDSAIPKAGVAATADLAVGQPVIHRRGDGVIPPAELGNPSEWGVVKIEVNTAAGAVHPMSEGCTDVTHGRWCYGWYTITSGKHCYSNYLADTVHKTTVRVQNVDYGSGWVNPNDVSYAWKETGLVYTCYAYYDNA